MFLLSCDLHFYNQTNSLSSMSSIFDIKFGSSQMQRGKRPILAAPRRHHTSQKAADGFQLRSPARPGSKAVRPGTISAWTGWIERSSRIPANCPSHGPLTSILGRSSRSSLRSYPNSMPEKSTRKERGRGTAKTKRGAKTHAQPPQRSIRGAATKTACPRRTRAKERGLGTAKTERCAKTPIGAGQSVQANRG